MADAALLKMLGIHPSVGAAAASATPNPAPPNGRVAPLNLRAGAVYLAPSGRRCRYVGPHGRSAGDRETPWFLFTYLGTSGEGFTFTYANVSLLREVR